MINCFLFIFKNFNWIKFYSRGISGYDSDNDPIYPKKLQQTQLKVINGKVFCEDSNTNLLYCTVNSKTGSNICSGDSGGPLMYFSNKKWYLYGLTSNSPSKKNGNCDNRLPSSFEKVPEHIDWIRKVIFYFNAISKNFRN